MLAGQARLPRQDGLGLADSASVAQQRLNLTGWYADPATGTVGGRQGGRMQQFALDEAIDVRPRAAKPPANLFNCQVHLLLSHTCHFSIPDALCVIVAPEPLDTEQAYWYTEGAWHTCHSRYRTGQI